LSLVTSLLAAIFPPRREAIAELIPGRRALVRGTVVARDLIESTLTAERCVYYRYSVEAWRNTHMAGLASEGYWALTRFDEAIVEFYLQDEAGDRVIVAPQRARIERGRGVDPSHVDMGVIGQRAQELAIRPGDVLEIQGMVARVHDLYDEDRNYREAPTRFMVCAADNDVLEIRMAESAASGSVSKSL
jgi:hypothetical protein